MKIINPAEGELIDKDSIQVTVRITDEGGGAESPQIYHNGTLVAGNVRGVKKQLKDVSGQDSFTKTYMVSLVAGENDGIVNMSYIKAYLDNRLYELYEDLTGNGQDAISISSGEDFAVAGEGD